MAALASKRAQCALSDARSRSEPVKAPLVARHPFTSCGDCARRSAAGAAGASRRSASVDALRCRSVPQHRVCFFGFGGNDEPEYEDELTVAKLQVGIFGRVEELKRDLDRTASLMDTDDENAAQELVQDLVILLSRNLEYCAYASSAIFLTDDFDEAEQKFQQVAMKERLVFKKETLSNVGGRLDRGSLKEAGADVGLDKWLCVTLIIATECAIKLPKVRALADLKDCLTLLGGLRVDDVVAVELLWTPQEEGDAYSKDELLADYPGLANL
ncbi:MAG: membrane protein [Monoraphidium minutum]|nr:MAG: membrane protein [Monoraphidium minutum]